MHLTLLRYSASHFLQLRSFAQWAYSFWCIYRKTVLLNRKLILQTNRCKVFCKAVLSSVWLQLFRDEKFCLDIVWVAECHIWIFARKSLEAFCFNFHRSNLLIMCSSSSKVSNLKAMWSRPILLSPNRSFGYRLPHWTNQQGTLTCNKLKDFLLSNFIDVSKISS